MTDSMTQFLPKDPINVENGRLALSNQLQAMIKAFSEGESVNELVVERTNFIDELLKRLWVELNFNQYEDLALIAVGGYGRGDLQPYSDIDILFLKDSPIDENLSNIISNFTSLVWDLKLELGQSVRTIDECLDEGSKDVTIATNLLESRLIIGNEETYKKLYKIVESEDFWPSDNFYNAKNDEQNDRHRSYKDTAFSLEPDIKNNPGGLRDIQTLLWISHKKSWQS